MPVCLHRDSSNHDLLKRATGLCGKPPVEFRGSDANCIDIGLINNMPNGALQSTECQFLSLLDSASGGVVVRVSLYALPEVPRTDAGRRHIEDVYSAIESLWDRRLDGLIVTGTEPRASNLMDEPYWGSLIRVIEWAEHNTHSTVWSCLAAHAAVLHLDGVSRHRLHDKRSGVFEFAPVSDHQLAAGVPRRVLMPHSRWNDLHEKELTASGYRVLTRSDDSGVDAFVKKRKSLFVFFQGHPEYEANTLLLEYRRDIGRYLSGERDTYPTMPHGYFGTDAARALTALQERAVRDRREELLQDFPAPLVEKDLTKKWDSTATRVYGNWLEYLCAAKQRRLQERSGRKEFARERQVVLKPRFATGD